MAKKIKLHKSIRGEKISKPILKTNSNGRVVRKFSSITDAAKSINVAPMSISIAAHQKKLYKGFYWNFAEPERSKINRPFRKCSFVCGTKISQLAEIPAIKFTKLKAEMFLSVAEKTKLSSATEQKKYAYIKSNKPKLYKSIVAYNKAVAEIIKNK